MLSRGIHNAFHAKLLRPYHPDTAFERTPVAPPPIQFPDGHTKYEVEKLVRYRLHRGKPQYLVHCKVMMTMKTLGYLPLTSPALNSLLTIIEPRTALPQGGMMIGSIYLLPCIDMPRIDMPRLGSTCRFHIFHCHVT
jgi:hypothetical protein